jgi:translation initiation factor 3 subunit M
MWVIDSIRSGLVEGKLSQQKQEFLIHRSTYRVFGENQWREVASRLETWKSSLVNVLAVIRTQKEEFIREKEAELNGSGMQSGQGYRPDRRQRNAQTAIEVE